ncbi:UDP-N-acetylmuramate--alanine ligase [Salegentibacter salinarum]|uniref:UDP-N-acetylmuramate--L-alanine ligase n=1 Tax=Salegentibacter salinarum TaxID=447422 RepID=A0A2N0TPA9_9FLAO|nr:UDP-N-acetylmuramate--L-alanine ligase [Salegentibacter salinarum]PKD16563.1 UDP-N-acetylmuramate--alanine ligase [Salegentibacter salinarum]SKB65843.1 UDP-N-acetylmuramate--L-alanine ligase [Salegentibacter salinarum]
MQDLNHIQNIYFIGIGGIGMSALARYFKFQGKNVAGYDKTSTSLTRTLEAEDIVVVYDEKINSVPAEFQDKENTLVVYTPAVPEAHEQLAYFRNNEFTLNKRAAVLGLISKGKTTLAVAGTHGKTTTTAILGHLLKETGAKVTGFLGGISEDIQSNLILKGDDVIVVEADEFDRSFLHLSPNIAAITSMDADHLDIYGKKEELEDTFRQFAKLVPENGTLFIKNGLPIEGKTFGIEDDADYSAQNIKIENGTYHFDLKTPNGVIEGFMFNLPGKHNVLNAITALAMAIQFGSPIPKLARALYGFKGVKRRFSYKIKSDRLVLIDDYAHHPAEIAAVNQAVREMHPGKKVLAVFQPHLFSRTRDFADDFAESLALFDELLLLDIYPARELPIEGITSSWILEKVSTNSKKLIQKENIIDEIKRSNPEVVVLMGAGSIGEEVESIKNALQDEA